PARSRRPGRGRADGGLLGVGVPRGRAPGPRLAATGRHRPQPAVLRRHPGRGVLPALAGRQRRHPRGGPSVTAVVGRAAGGGAGTRRAAVPAAGVARRRLDPVRGRGRHRPGGRPGGGRRPPRPRGGADRDRTRGRPAAGAVVAVPDGLRPGRRVPGAGGGVDHAARTGARTVRGGQRRARRRPAVLTTPPVPTGSPRRRVRPTGRARRVTAAGPAGRPTPARPWPGSTATGSCHRSATAPPGRRSAGGTGGRSCRSSGSTGTRPGRTGPRPCAWTGSRSPRTRPRRPRRWR